jgi:hypothetical protein
MRVLSMVDGQINNISTFLWPTHVGSSILHTPVSSWNTLEDSNISQNFHNLWMNFDIIILSPLTYQQTARKFNRPQISRGSIKSDSYTRAIATVFCALLDSAAAVPLRGLAFNLQTYVYVTYFCQN